jgi:hypothetical protein
MTPTPEVSPCTLPAGPAPASAPPCPRKEPPPCSRPPNLPRCLVLTVDGEPRARPAPRPPPPARSCLCWRRSRPTPATRSGSSAAARAASWAHGSRAWWVVQGGAGRGLAAAAKHVCQDQARICWAEGSPLLDPCSLPNTLYLFPYPPPAQPGAGRGARLLHKGPRRARLGGAAAARRHVVAGGRAAHPQAVPGAGGAAAAAHPPGRSTLGHAGAADPPTPPSPPHLCLPSPRPESNPPALPPPSPPPSRSRPTAAGSRPRRAAWCGTTATPTPTSAIGRQAGGPAGRGGAGRPSRRLVRARGRLAASWLAGGAGADFQAGRVALCLTLPRRRPRS